MTAKEQTILRLTEVLNFLEKVGNGEWSDSLSAAIKALQGDNPFEDDKPQYKECVGECDKTYEIQQEYESTIQDAIDELNDIQGKTKEDCEKLKHIIRDLNLAI